MPSGDGNGRLAAAGGCCGVVSATAARGVRGRCSASVVTSGQQHRRSGIIIATCPAVRVRIIGRIPSGRSELQVQQAIGARPPASSLRTAPLSSASISGFLPSDHGEVHSDRSRTIGLHLVSPWHGISARTAYELLVDSLLHSMTYGNEFTVYGWGVIGAIALRWSSPCPVLVFARLGPRDHFTCHRLAVESQPMRRGTPRRTASSANLNRSARYAWRAVTEVRSSRVRTRSGGRTSAWSNTPRSASTCFSTAWKGIPSSFWRSSVTRRCASGLWSCTRAATTSGQAEASPETAPTAPRSIPARTKGSEPMNTSMPSMR